MKNKVKMAYWLVSDCKTDNRREDYVKELQKYINIDIFGRCGNKTFPRGKELDFPHFLGTRSCLVPFLGRGTASFFRSFSVPFLYHLRFTVTNFRKIVELNN